MRLKKETGKEDVYFLKLDLADIPSAAAAARELASKETRLDLLFNNAYVFHFWFDMEWRERLQEFENCTRI
jgi:NAD(P)-dependent dehydrogenase (short-subunit alcohol dehydrogenase family)